MYVVIGGWWWWTEVLVLVAVLVLMGVVDGSCRWKLRVVVVVVGVFCRW